MAIKGYGTKGLKDLLVIPIAFVSDHVETLFEIDIEYGELAKEVGVDGFRRAESLNDDPEFIEAMADLVGRHLTDHASGKGKACSVQLGLLCPGYIYGRQEILMVAKLCGYRCVNEKCRPTKDFFASQ